MGCCFGRSFIVALACMVALAAGAAIAAARCQSPEPASGGLKPMVDLRLQTLDGKTVNPEDWRGKVIVVDFWATWCGPCIAEIPEFNELQRRFNGKGVEIVGVALASGTPAEVKPFVDRFKMKYSVLMGDDDQTYDLNIVGYPTTYLVTKDWRIYKIYMGTGRTKAKQLEKDIETLLASGHQATGGGE